MFEGKALNEERSITCSKGQCSLTAVFFQPSYNSTGLEYDHASVRVWFLDTTKGLETRFLVQVV